MAVEITPVVTRKLTIGETGVFPSVISIPATVNAGGTTCTLPISYCGSIVQIYKNATDQVITLPAPASCPGASFKFVQMSAAAAGICTLVSPTAASVMGEWILTAAAFTCTPQLAGAAGTRFRFLAVSLLGDSAELISDGVYWQVHAKTNVAAGMAFAA